ncbi:hypothetical protein OUZ56_019720 [Daphnia magna]|uniref:Uncharacterized protein n=2 Tax=Daphnia magna TaxID=35525 RepID=A0ABQ9ZCF8_9CRUS|nr:hypothetical protein OUZ56_019720 [Daphnia magna]
MLVTFTRLSLQYQPLFSTVRVSARNLTTQVVEPSSRVQAPKTNKEQPKMHFFSLLFSFFVLLATCAGFSVHNPISIDIPRRVDSQNIGVAPDRTCTPPKQMDRYGNCRAPWGR